MRFAPRNIVGCTAALLVSLSSISAAPRATTVTVMTQNMDAGTDLGFALAYIYSSTPTVGIDLTYQEILQSGFADRATILAKQIAASEPDLISLQEATVWSVGPNPFSLSPQFDQLELLLDALSDLGQGYSVVDIHDLTSLAAPMSNGDWLGFLDRDVILVRDAAGLSLSNLRHDTFSVSFTVPGTPLGDISVPQGWIAVDVTLGGDTFTFVNTHLSGVPGIDVGGIQIFQAQDLLTEFGGLTRVVIAGDFNSNATHTPPERTPTYGVMLASGLTDAWSAANPGQPGFTWPLYVEDPPAAHPRGPFERIDFIFETGFGIQSVKRIGWTGRHASDHAGVVAVLNF